MLTRFEVGPHSLASHNETQDGVEYKKGLAWLYKSFSRQNQITFYVHIHYIVIFFYFCCCRPGYLSTFITVSLPIKP